MRKLWLAWSAPIIVGAIGFAFWEGAIAIISPDGFVLPAPTSIGQAFFENWSEIFQGARVTGLIIVIGLLGGVVAAFAAALLVTRFRLAAEIITPLAVGLSAMPIIALAPIFNNWFGLVSSRGNQLIVALLVFFPVFINTVKGLTQVEDSQIELMESYAASKWTIMREVRIPNALPFVFTSLKIASSLAVIAAIVAEYFGGRQDALGNLITSSAGLAKYAEAWAAVLAGTIIGTILYLIVLVIERRTIPWHASIREQEINPGG
jgi:NitT/TauT family transport system permease protein